MRALGLAMAVAVLVTTSIGQDEIGILSRAELEPVSGIDLGIADDETYRRPNSWAQNTLQVPSELMPTERILVGDLTGPASRPGVSIAWRNAAQIEEVEVRVRNLGNQAGEGKVHVEILDETGRILLTLRPPEELQTIRLPAFAAGGREGKILRMSASRELNNLIDRFDKDHRRYNVRAVVTTIGEDANPFDNIKTKSWNVSHRVEPGFVNHFNYIFQNHESEPVEVRWLFERTPYPNGWRVAGIPPSDTPFILAPGEQVRGSLSMVAPNDVDEGAYLESRLSLVRTDTELPFAQHEWFQVYDTIPPVVSNYRVIATSDHRIAIQALVADSGSGVREATGVSSQYSTDGGRTFSVRAHNYKAGNFVVPTLFETVLGPFAPGTEIQLRFSALDTAGNITSMIPEDAVAAIAPPLAENLIDFAYVFPRTQPNPIFTLTPGSVEDLGSIATRFATTFATTSPSPAQVDALSEALSSLPITEESLGELNRSVELLSRSPDTAPAGERLQEVIEALGLPKPSATIVEIAPMQLERVDAPGAALLQMSTLQLTVQ